jgi:hypothetical protein
MCRTWSLCRTTVVVVVCEGVSGVEVGMAQGIYHLPVIMFFDIHTITHPVTYLTTQLLSEATQTYSTLDTYL